VKSEPTTVADRPSRFSRSSHDRVRSPVPQQTSNTGNSGANGTLRTVRRRHRRSNPIVINRFIMSYRGAIAPNIRRIRCCDLSIAIRSPPRGPSPRQDYKSTNDANSRPGQLPQQRLNPHSSLGRIRRIARLKPTATTRRN